MDREKTLHIKNDIQCPAVKGQGIFVLAMVGSGFPNAKARQAIRDTWLQSSHPIANVTVKRIFVFGTTTNRTLQKLVSDESIAHQDIIQGDFKDAYDNLTLKTMFMIEWAHEHCKVADYVLKLDDDAYVNMKTLPEYLLHNPLRRTFLGYYLTGIRPQRSRVMKWFVPKTVYPGTVYPDFVAGWAYALSCDMLSELIQASKTMPYLRLEDIYLTGLVRDKIGAKTRVNYGFQARLNLSDVQSVRTFFAVHFVTVQDHYRFWRKQQEIAGAPQHAMSQR